MVVPNTPWWSVGEKLIQHGLKLLSNSIDLVIIL